MNGTTVHHKHWTSIHRSGYPRIANVLNRCNCFVHLSFRRVNTLTEWKAEARFFPFTVYRSQWGKHRLYVYSRLLNYCLRTPIGHGIPLNSAAVWRSTCWIQLLWIVRVQKWKMLDVCSSSIEELSLSLLGLHVGFSHYLEKFFRLGCFSDFCISLGVKGILKIKTYIDYDVLLLIEVHHVIGRKVFFKIWPQFGIGSFLGGK